MSQSFHITVNSTPTLYIIPASRAVESINIQASKQTMYQTATFDYTDVGKTTYDRFAIGEEVTIHINGVSEFDGFIAGLKKTYVGGAIKLDVTCIGNTFMLERYVTDEDKTYTDKKTGYIVKDLLDTYSGMVHDSISSTDGVTVASIVFNAETLGTCFTRLSELDGYSFYVGTERL